MAKFFGEYLVEKDLLSESDLIEALVEQSKTVPSTLEVVYSGDIFNHQQILSALKNQAESGGEFVTSCRTLDLWTEDVEKKVSREISKKRPPLGKVLLKNNKIEIKQLISALDEFLADRMDESMAEASASTAEAAVVPESTAPEVEIDLSGVGEAKPTAEVGDGAVSDAEEYMAVFTDELYYELEGNIFSIEPMKEMFLTEMESIQNNFQALYGGAKFAGVNSSEELVERIITAMTKIQEIGKDVDEPIVWEFKAVAKGTLDLLKEIREALKSGQNESAFLDQDSTHKNHATIQDDWATLFEKLP